MRAPRTGGAADRPWPRAPARRVGGVRVAGRAPVRRMRPRCWSASATPTACWWPGRARLAHRRGGGGDRGARAGPPSPRGRLVERRGGGCDAVARLLCVGPVAGGAPRGLGRGRGRRSGRPAAGGDGVPGRIRGDDPRRQRAVARAGAARGPGRAGLDEQRAGARAHPPAPERRAHGRRSAVADCRSVLRPASVRARSYSAAESVGRRADAQGHVRFRAGREAGAPEHRRPG